MIDAIIFSDNNPQMLSLTLQSLEKNLPKDSKVSIIYSCSDTKTPKGYLSLMSGIKTSLNLYWNPTNSLKETILGVLKTITSKEVIILTDGDVLFEKFDDSVIKECLAQDDVLCHSLRLGLNTTVCVRMECENVIKAEESENHIKWNWTKHYLDFGYPFSLHGHVFNTKEILKLIKKTNFSSYIELEDGLQMFEYYPKEFMTAFKESKSIFMPYIPDSITIEDFLNGYIPDFDNMNFSNMKQCEGNVKFETIKKENNEKK